MPAYAMVVVVDAPDLNDAHRQVSQQTVDGTLEHVLFVGEAWEVNPTYPAQRDIDMDGVQIDVDATFDTDDCLNQRRGA